MKEKTKADLKISFASLILCLGICTIAWVFVTPGDQIWQAVAGGLAVGLYVRLAWRK